MRRAVATALAALLLVPGGTTAQSSEDLSRLWELVPPSLEYGCQELEYRTAKRVVEPSVAALQCFYEGGPTKVDDVGLFLFDSKAELRGFWKNRKRERLGRVTRGDCNKNKAGVMDTAAGELICYRSSGKARIRWIDEDNLLYGALDTDWGRIAYAYGWWQKHIGATPSPRPAPTPHPATAVDGSAEAGHATDGETQVDTGHGAKITIDDTQANGVVRATVKKATGPYSAIIEVENLRDFWVAVDVVERSQGMVLVPNALVGEDGDLGAPYALTAVLGPGATTTYEATFYPESVGGTETVRLHYDGQSIGGWSAVALNVLQIIAYGLTAEKLSGSTHAAQAAVKTVSDLPDWIEIVQSHQDGPPSFEDIPAYAAVLLGSKVGRAAIIEALEEFDVSVTDAELSAFNVVHALYEGGTMMFDLEEAVRNGETQGSVTITRSCCFRARPE